MYSKVSLLDLWECELSSSLVVAVGCVLSSGSFLHLGSFLLCIDWSILSHRLKEHPLQISCVPSVWLSVCCVANCSHVVSPNSQTTLLYLDFSLWPWHSGFERCLAVSAFLRAVSHMSLACDWQPSGDISYYEDIWGNLYRLSLRSDSTLCGGRWIHLNDCWMNRNLVCSGGHSWQPCQLCALPRGWQVIRQPVCFLWAAPVLSSGVQPLLFTSLVTPLFPLQADPPLHAYYLLKSLKALFLALRNSLLFFCLWVNSCILRTPVIAYMPVSHRCPFPGLNHISRFLLHIPSWVADNSNPKHLVRPQLNAWPWSVPSLCSHLLIPSLTLPR